MQEFTDANFATEVLGSSELVLVDFFGMWCRPCHALLPILERVQDQHPGVKMGKVNIDENPDTTDNYSVTAVPTIILFKNGAPVKRFVGLQNEGTLNEAINTNL